ncbi:hypothetical protein Acy02nite_00140 [Actinoplanes cyaneus]|uniref:Uncharacterized protein n=1 Tax=Actinoplanes cyaneus TaxID=52696 RepID=A0A919IAM5_9ACTN|nr:hypothetical protein Acy02nite_00140 [Actinoplanes cyaneus]
MITWQPLPVRELAKPSAFSGVCGPLTDRFCTRTWVVTELCCMEVQTEVAGSFVTPSWSVSRQAVASRYSR